MWTMQLAKLTYSVRGQSFLQLAQIQSPDRLLKSLDKFWKKDNNFWKHASTWV